MRRIWLILLTLVLASVLSGCPVFTRGEGPAGSRPSLADSPAADDPAE